MSTKSALTFSFAVRSVLLTGSALCGVLAATSAFAQDVGQNQQVESVVVTGSRVPQLATNSISPVLTANSEDLAVTGTTRVEDFLNSLPQVLGDQTTGTIGSAGTGTATVNLRNLGPQRTLVLIDGRRLAPGGYFPGNNSSGSAADLNAIPEALIAHVDVLTGGASAVYGADAVAGVVNFVMDDHFQGVRITGSLGGYEHGQQQSAIQSIVTAAGQPLPQSTVWDGAQRDINLVVGSDFAQGQGNFTAYLGYRATDGVTGADRDFSACTLSQATTTSPYSCGGSSTSYPGRFKVSGKSYSVDANGNFVPYTASFNYGPYDYFQRPDERTTGGTFFHYDVAPKVTLYGELNFMQDSTTQQVSPTGYVYGSGPGPTGGYYVTCNNPFLSAGQVSTICGPQAGTANLVEVGIGRRNVEGGPQQFAQTHTEFRGVVGLKGTIDDADNWHYDVYFSDSKTDSKEIYQNGWLVPHMTAALQAVTDPATGNIVCSGNQNGGNAYPGCVPYDPWKAGAVTAAQTNYLQAPFEFTGSSTEQIFEGNVNADLGKYGVKSPWATEGVGFALGTQYRSSSLVFLPDANLQQGLDSNRAGVDILPIPKAKMNVWEIYPEARIPIVTDAPGIRSLDAELGYRYSDYSVGFNTSTWKAGMNWSPIEMLRFRGEVNRAIRAPNLAELYGSRYVGYDGSADPCAGTTPTATLAQCANSGVTTAEYGKIDSNPAAQYNGLLGGNPALKPERATTKTIGVVVTPDGWLSGLTASVDYYEITIKNVIGTLGANYILNTCVKSGQDCNLVTRTAAGSLFEGNTGYVTDTLANTGSQQNQGVDVSLSDHYDTDSWGAFSATFSGTYLMALNINNLGAPSYNEAGLYGLVAGQPNPKWRHRAQITWDTPLNGFAVNLTWRHVDGTGLDAASSQSALQNSAQLYTTDLGVPTRDYFDLGASYQVTEKITVRMGVNNIFDQDPPLVELNNLSSTAGSGNTFPALYDTLGRNLFANVDIHL